MMNPISSNCSNTIWRARGLISSRPRMACRRSCGQARIAGCSVDRFDAAGFGWFFNLRDFAVAAFDGEGADHRRECAGRRIRARAGNPDRRGILFPEAGGYEAARGFDPVKLCAAAGIDEVGVGGGGEEEEMKFAAVTDRRYTSASGKRSRIFWRMSASSSGW